MKVKGVGARVQSRSRRVWDELHKYWPMVFLLRFCLGQFSSLCWDRNCHEPDGATLLQIRKIQILTYRVKASYAGQHMHSIIKGHR